MRNLKVGFLIVGLLSILVCQREAKAIEATGILFGCNLNQVPPPVSYLVFTDTSEGIIRLNGSFADATPPRPTQPVESIAQLAKKSGLKGTLTKVEFTMRPCRWKVDQKELVTTLSGVQCSSYEVDIKFTDDQGRLASARVKSITANLERVTRESAYGIRQTYESSLTLQGSDDRTYRSLEIFKKNSCSVEG